MSWLLLAFGFVIEGTVLIRATFDLILSKNHRGGSDQDVVVPEGDRGVTLIRRTACSL